MHAFLLLLLHMLQQVSNWFINARVRLWKPMVEEMYVEETKEQDNMDMTSPDGIIADLECINGRQNQNPPPLTRLEDDKKPTQDQLVRIDSDCLSSIVTNPEKNDSKTTKTVQNHHIHQQQQQQHGFGRIETFGGMELDFSSYANDHNVNQNFSGGGGVSLTLGLQQHGHGNGVSLAFSPASQSSLFYGRDPIEECQPVHQYSLLDSEGQNLPYRNLMGAQLLHDLAG
jgi:hypothetical protein